jgi:hypothetical protein
MTALSSEVLKEYGLEFGANLQAFRGNIPLSG